jgi:hypothetical protein
MRFFNRGLAAAAAMFAVTSAAQADCARITALGENVTYDLAVLFSTNALKNTLAGQGRIGKGQVTTKCETGGVMTTCRSSQLACTGATPKACLGAWLCF